MIARLTAVIVLVVVTLQPALALGLTSSVQFGPPTIRLEPTGALYATRHALVQLPEGETALALPLPDLGISVDDVVLQVSPLASVRIIAVRTGPDGPRWLLRAAREVEAALALTYPVEGLSWAIEYAATLARDGSIDLAASLRLDNDGKRDLEDARLVGEFARATLSLGAGQSITVEQPWLSATISADHVERVLVYDRVRHGEAAVELLTVHGEATARATALPPGSIRVYAAPEAGGEFMTQASIAYTPPREPVEFVLGPASGVRVSRTLEDAEEVDKRLDARNMVVLFDLRESWSVEVRNLREEPVDLLVREKHEGVWRVEQHSEDYERVDAETLAFRVSLEPQETREVVFRIRHLNRQP